MLGDQYDLDLSADPVFYKAPVAEPQEAQVPPRARRSRREVLLRVRVTVEGDMPRRELVRSLKGFLEGGELLSLTGWLKVGRVTEVRDVDL